MGAHCPDCLRDDLIELPPLSIHDLTADFECQHCGCIFELGFSSHSPDPEDQDNGQDDASGCPACGAVVVSFDELGGYEFCGVCGEIFTP